MGHHVEEADQGVRFGCHGDPATQRRKIDIPEARFLKIEVLLGAKWGRWSPRIECQTRWHR